MYKEKHSEFQTVSTLLALSVPCHFWGNLLFFYLVLHVRPLPGDPGCLPAILSGPGLIKDEILMTLHQSNNIRVQIRFQTLMGFHKGNGNFFENYNFRNNKPSW